MSAAELKEMKKKVKKYIDQADERAVNIVYAMLEADQSTERIHAWHTGLALEQEEVLDRHIELYEKGQMEFSTWEQARGRITSKAKNGI